MIYPTLLLGLPFVHPFLQLPTSGALNYYELAVIGLGLNEAAYLAEIVRAGILSVDVGQEEAATALGMTWTQTMWRIVIPQSMRVIIPPTGNEFIGMLKTHLPRDGRAVRGRPVLGLARHLRPAVRAHPTAARGVDLVPRDHLGAHGRPVLSGETVRARHRRPREPDPAGSGGSRRPRSRRFASSPVAEEGGR